MNRVAVNKAEQGSGIGYIVFFGPRPRSGMVGPYTQSTLISIVAVPLIFAVYFRKTITFNFATLS